MEGRGGTAVGRRLRRAGVAVCCALAAACTSAPYAPKVSQAYHQRGQAKLVLDRDYNGAIEDFTQAIEFDGSNADAYLGRGLAYMKLGDGDAAQRDFREAVSLDPRLEAAVKPFR